MIVYLGIQDGDGERDLEYLAAKVAGLRIFEDGDGAMNRSVIDAGGEVLVVSQFTLLGDCRRGRRPSFTAAMAPAEAEDVYLSFVERLRARGLRVGTGRFQAMMDVRSVNRGPVTLLLDSRKAF
jgi:D-tyrosyl-tRNA(Tyr) deacylase